MNEKEYYRKLARLVFTVSDILVEGEKAVAVWTNKGESVSGEPYTNRGTTVFHFSGGKITFISDYFKDTSFTGNQ